MKETETGEYLYVIGHLQKTWVRDHYDRYGVYECQVESRTRSVTVPKRGELRNAALLQSRDDLVQHWQYGLAAVLS